MRLRTMPQLLGAMTAALVTFAGVFLIGELARRQWWPAHSGIAVAGFVAFAAAVPAAWFAGRGIDRLLARARPGARLAWHLAAIATFFVGLGSFLAIAVR